MATQQALAGQIAQRYDIEALAGSHGEVELYDAVDRQLDRPVTMQVLSAGLDKRGKTYRRFLKHQQLASSIHNCAVLAVFDAGVWEDRPYSVMSRAPTTVPGDLYRPGTPPDLAAALKVTREAVETLQCCRDAGLTGWTFSPDAVRIGPDGSACVAVLEGLSGQFSSSHAATDAPVLAALLKLMLSGQADATEARLRAALVPGHVLGVLARLESPPGAGPATAGEVAAYLAEVEAASLKPTQAYEPGVALAAIHEPAPQAGAGSTLAPYEAPTLAAPVPMLGGVPYDVPAEGPGPEAPDAPVRPGSFAKAAKRWLGKGNIGGHPQTPGRETPAPLLGNKDRIGGQPHSPGREISAPLTGEGTIGGHPQNPGGEAPAPLLDGIAGEDTQTPGRVTSVLPGWEGNGYLGEEPQTPDKEAPARLSAVMVVLVAVAAVAFLAVALPRMSAALGPGAQDAGANPAPVAVTVPDLRGKTLDEARNMAGEASLNLATGEAAYDANAPKGTVAGQEPAPQAQAQAAGLITVTLSIGPEPTPTAEVAAPTPQPVDNPPEPQRKGKKGGDDKDKDDD